MKSLLHVALIAPGGYSNDGLIKAFFDNGFTEYTCFDFQEKTFNSDRESMRRMLIQEVERLRPDMIFMQIQGSDILDLETFQALSKISFTVNFTFDIRTKEQTEWIYNLAPVLGLICFSNQRDVDECRTRGFNNTMVLQSSADYEVYKPGNEERKGVVFIGNNYVNTNIEFPLSKERREMVEFLQSEFPDQFKVYGNNWNGSKLIMQKEEIEILQSAAIVINQNNFDAESYVSDRVWRAIFCGALCLTKYFNGVEKLFDPYNHLECWNSLEELKRLIDHYLDHSLSAIKNASDARQHALLNHTWASRVKEMMAAVSFINDVWVYDTRIGVVDKEACTKAGAHVVDGIIPGPFDQHLKDHGCDCGKLIFKWESCGCVNKEFQLRAQENI